MNTMLLLEVLILFGGFFGMYINYGYFTMVVVRWCKKPVKGKNKKQRQPKLTTSETIKCFIPLKQACYVRESLYRTNGPFLIMSIITGVLIVLRLLNTFLLPINGYVMLVTTFMMWLAVILHLIIYGIITADCAHMYDYSWFTIIMCFLFPHIACWYLKNNIPVKMEELQKEETFSEHNGDTVIKSKHN